MRPGIDIIVVNYRCPGDLAEFLDSLAEFPPEVPWSLVIANVEPTPEDEQVVADCSLPHTSVIFPDNVGYARAVNRAATMGDREVLAAFNADTKLMKGVVIDCYNALNSNPTWGILGPRLIDDDGRITAGGFLPTDRGFHQLNSDEFGDIRDDAVTISGAAYFVKRSVWNELTECPIYRNRYPGAEGAFLMSPLYYEETWCSRHASAHRYKNVFFGPAVMIHNWNRAARGSSYARESLPVSKVMFEEMCELHGIQVV